MKQPWHEILTFRIIIINFHSVVHQKTLNIQVCLGFDHRNAQVNTHLYIHIFIGTYSHTYMQTYTNVNIYMQRWAFAFRRIHTDTLVHAHRHMYAYTRTQTFSYIYALHTYVLINTIRAKLSIRFNISHLMENLKNSSV